MGYKSLAMALLNAQGRDIPSRDLSNSAILSPPFRPEDEAVRRQCTDIGVAMFSLLEEPHPPALRDTARTGFSRAVSEGMPNFPPDHSGAL